MKNSRLRTRASVTLAVAAAAAGMGAVGATSGAASAAPWASSLNSMAAASHATASGTGTSAFASVLGAHPNSGALGQQATASVTGQPASRLGQPRASQPRAGQSRAAGARLDDREQPKPAATGKPQVAAAQGLRPLPVAHGVAGAKGGQSSSRGTAPAPVQSTARQAAAAAKPAAPAKAPKAPKAPKASKASKAAAPAKPPAAAKPAAPRPAAPHRPAPAPAPAKPYTIYDSVTPTAIPAGQQVATYSNGHYQASWSELRGRHNVLWIDTNGSNPGSNALDVEPGDATPSGAAQWVKERLTSWPNALAIVYTMRSEWQQVKDAIGSLPGQMQSRVQYWIADPTGVPHLVPGSTATQWYWGPNYDITTALPQFNH